MMRHLFLNRLHQMGVTTVLGEIDFGGGPLEPSIAGAVTSTDKTLVFLSKDIFQVMGNMSLESHVRGIPTFGLRTIEYRIKPRL